MALDFGLLFSKDLFPASSVSGQGMSANPDTVIWNDVGIGIVPVGAIVAWAKSLTDCPPLIPSFQECNGGEITDGDSPFYGQNTPNLNGGNRFLRGQTTSGGTGGSETHTHTVGEDTAGNIGQVTVGAAGTTSATSTLPSYYEVVWVMRIK